MGGARRGVHREAEGARRAAAMRTGTEVRVAAATGIRLSLPSPTRMDADALFSAGIEHIGNVIMGLYIKDLLL